MFKALLPTIRALPVGELRTEVFSQVPCSLPHSHTDWNFSVRKVFFSVSLKVLSDSIACLTSSSQGRRFEVHWLTVGWGCSFGCSEWSNPTRFTMGSRAQIPSFIWSTNTHGVPARGGTFLGAGYAVVKKDSSTPASMWLTLCWVTRQKPSN